MSRATPPDLAPDASAAQRRALRRARVADGARLLPFLGGALFLLPDFVLSDGPAAAGATAPWLIYLFASWLMLLGLAAWLGRLHLRAEAEAPDARVGDDGDG
ncbi:hypothetical protein [Jannaschia marina]|uniref:hypothetical protein n=1 Tax=Jannaschia marina TaxID=2741674 RepID=UPI0015CD914A|nr:hypothetical protein [Jannaschia marina]